MIKITFKVKSLNLKIKKSLSKLVASAIYQNMDDKKHDGFKYRNKIFKDCVFQTQFDTKRGEISIYFNSLDDKSLEEMAKAVLSGNFKIGNIQYSDMNIESLKDNIDEKNGVLVGTGSILVYKTVNNNREFMFSNNPHFIDILKRNLFQKYNALFKEEYNGELSIKILKSSRDSKCFYYGKYPYFSKKYTVMIHADKKMLEMIAKTGLGSGSMKGFGFLHLVDLGD